MFEDLWNRRLAQAGAQAKALAAELKAKERQVEQLLERILDASLPSVITAYEERIRKLEADKLLIREKMASMGRPASGFGDTLRTALEFLANPWDLWSSGQEENRRAVLGLTFANRLRYARSEGFRTANLASPFKALTQICDGKKRWRALMVRVRTSFFKFLASGTPISPPLTVEITPRHCHDDEGAIPGGPGSTGVACAAFCCGR